MYIYIVESNISRSVLYGLRSIHEAGESKGYGKPNSFIICAFYMVKYSAKVYRQYSGRIYNKPTNIFSFKNCLDKIPIIVAYF